jgi:hypothetical protein
MDHPILLGKPFGNCLVIALTLMSILMS